MLNPFFKNVGPFNIEKLLDGATKSLEYGFKSIKMRLGREYLSMTYLIHTSGWIPFASS